MRRILILGVVSLLVLAACGGDESPFGTSAASGATSTPGPPPSDAPETTQGTTSTSQVATTAATSAPPATASPTTTSTTTSTTQASLPPVTLHPGLPSAESRDAIPWGQVDGDWVLVLHSGDTFNPSWVEGPTALYLVSPGGVRYQVAAWAPGAPAPWYIADWSPDGERALLHYGGFPDFHSEMRLIYLADGMEHSVAAAPELDDIGASFTKPTGRDVVHYLNDQTTETLECRYVDGSLFSFLAQQPVDWVSPITWLYGLEGTTVVVGDGAGLHLLDNQGVTIRHLDSPGDGCRPLKWWDQGSFLASCLPSGMANLGLWYHQLWFVPIDGGVAINLTNAVANPQFQDFGYVDAWRAGSEVFLQWAGDCGAARVDLLYGGGQLLPNVQISYEVVGTMGADVAVHLWDGCDFSLGVLQRVSADGAVVADLIPRIEGVIGVISAVSMPPVP